MNLILDCDGVVAEGRLIEAPDDHRQYLDLGPYDHSTVELWNHWTREHQVTLLTSRHHPDAADLIQVWLRQHFMRMPASIITHCVPARKGAVAKALGADLFVDDSVEAFNSAVVADVPKIYLMHNQGWAVNAAFDASVFQAGVTSDRRLRSWQELRKVVEG